MQKSRARADRRAVRAARRRNQRIVVGLIALLLIASIAYLALSSNNQPQEQEGPPEIDQNIQTITTASGLQYQDISAGAGNEANPMDQVTVHYTGWLEDGTKFDSSVDRNQPYQFTLGTGNVIQGWDEGVAGMKEGGKRRLIIPPALGYGEGGSPPVIPPNATLIFDVELIQAQ